MTWQVTVRFAGVADDVAGQPGSDAGIRVETTRGERAARGRA